MKKETTTWYLTDGTCRELITPVEVVRETPTKLLIRTHYPDGQFRDRMVNKSSGWGIYHTSYEKARAHLFDQNTKRLEAAKQELEAARREAGAIFKL